MGGVTRIRSAISQYGKDNGTYEVGPGCKYTSLQAAVDAAVAGQHVEVYPGTYTEDVTVPTGVSVHGCGVNCILDGNVVLQGTASLSGMLLTDGHYIEQDGVKYYV